MKRGKLLDLNDVLQHPGRKVDYAVETLLPDQDEVQLLAPIEGSIEAFSTNNLLFIRGTFNTRYLAECARCGAPIDYALTFEVDEQFPVEGTASSYGTKDYAHVKQDEEPYPLFEGNSLIIDALLLQILLLNLPLQPLCVYGWEGDCPEARKRGIITEEDSFHPELSKLKFLLDKENPDRGSTAE